MAITQLAAEKNLPKEMVLEAVEAALASAYKKDNLATSNVVVRIDRETGAVRVYTRKTVVEEVTDPRIEMTPKEARALKPDAVIGDNVDIETAAHDGGRIAAQTAKQVVLQRLREAEREIVYEEYSGKESDIVSGMVQRFEGKNVIIDLGKAEAVLPPAEQVKTEHYRAGQRLKLYLLEVIKSSKGPQVTVSRTHKNLLRRLFELEVPEIYKGTVELRSIAREPGHRSKVAVYSSQEGIDPVGACVGLRGIRIQNIVNELGGERIDVVQWDTDAVALRRQRPQPGAGARRERRRRRKHGFGRRAGPAALSGDRQGGAKRPSGGQAHRLAHRHPQRVDIAAGAGGRCRRRSGEGHRRGAGAQGCGEAIASPQGPAGGGRGRRGSRPAAGGRGGPRLR